MTTDERIIRLDEIALERAELEEAILKMELKLEETKVNQMTLGIIPDTAWLYRHKHALGMKKIQLKRLNVEHEKIKRLLRQERTLAHNERSKTFERNFLKVAKEILPEETYEKIRNLADEITSNQIETNKSSEADKENENEEKAVKKGTPWSKEDEEYLKENYKNATIEELSIALGRSENSIKSKIQIIKKSL
ncbi:hypothetical protein PMY38_10075 [Clostridium tertium]|uniref:hypothetical protein n=1 Tax=Clostridium tertium TaxID=1559 RepID=UPI00232DEC84|nr:hypothetical protein [Clostridium tertium]MDB1955389.1 hypothetical protein [Clostridium tertium]MDB1958945.1 hypothetical protein [Clostridium tertium]MDB1963821.1 hypothetical protein [Clostridium tertium]MDB1966088.1 hypothetical protein [Clostridium tertium]